MEQSRQNLLDQLLSLARSLPTAKLVEVLDFAAYLGTRSSTPPSHPERDSAPALLRHTGVFQFASGELDRLLADIAQMRTLDVGNWLM